MKSSGEIRRLARNVLANNWGGAVAVSFIVAIIAIAVSLAISFVQSIASIISAGIGTGAAVFNTYAGYHITYDFIPQATNAGMVATIGVVGAILAILLSVLSTIILASLQVGQARYFVNLASGRNSGIDTLFSQFTSGFLKAFGLCWYISLKTALWFLIGYIPGAILVVIGNSMMQSTIILSAVLVVIGICAMLAGGLLAIIAAYRYIMAYYVLADNPGVGIREAANRSKQLMHGHKAEFFILELSFIGWAFLCLFTCGIGYLFLSPYMSTAYAVFYCELIGRPTADNTQNPHTYNPNDYNPNGYNQNGYNPNINNQNGYNKDSTYASGTASPMPESGDAAGTQSTPEAPPVANMPKSEPEASSDAVPDMQADAPEIEQVDISKIGEDAPSIEEIGKDTLGDDKNSETEK